MTEMLKGIAASDGVAVAKAYLLVQPDLSFETVSVEDTSAEEARLDVALEASQNELSLIREKAVDSLGEEAAQVFDAHLMVLADPEMIGQIKETIRNKKVNAEAGLKEVTDMFITIFENMEDNPYMQERAADIRDVTKRVLRFFGIGESQLVTILADLIDKQTDPTIAPYAKTGEVTLRLSTKAISQELANLKLDTVEQEILAHGNLAELFYGCGDDNSLAKTTFDLLKETGKTITAAESLTAGLFQASLADFSGASAVFKGGFVTYSMEEKSKMLDIPLADLKEQGVVSTFTAEKMAEQARKLTESDLAVSLTGVAGPDSLEGQPAGTVFIGLATAEKVESVRVNIAGRSRSDVREIAVLHAFNLVRKTLLKA
ncbi:competence damage-inducible protein A [Streptococcus massiliensis]|uniref:Competence damage-inducible protein A n=2 Tax=Streptococcus massiliensis TaxID=313439 RepID=A0A380KZZ3_9STRE|nr:competence damage-inducible protein A [Streptococcus massiliensis]